MGGGSQERRQTGSPLNATQHRITNGKQPAYMIR